MGSVCAADLNETNNQIAIKDNNVLSNNDLNQVNLLEKNNTDSLKSANEDFKLSAGPKSLSDLGTLIKVTPNSLVLQDDFQYEGTDLIINKDNFVIDFNNHFLNANGHEGTVLTITGKNVTIKNMNFINGKGTMISYLEPWVIGRNPHPIRASIFPVIWAGENGVLDNVVFKNCDVGINWTGHNGLVRNSLFRDSKYEQIYNTGDNFRLLNSNFINLTGIRGELYWNNQDCQFFVNLYGSNNFMDSCIFTNCSSNGVKMTSGTVQYCNFSNMKYPIWGYIISHCNFYSCREADAGYNYGKVIRCASILEYCNIKDCNMDYTRVVNTGSGGSASSDTNVGHLVESTGILVSSPNIRYCNFTNNTVGGMISSAENGIIGCNFVDNTVKVFFSIRYNANTKYEVNNNFYLDYCNFTNNVFRNNYLFSVSGNCRVYNSIFVNNTVNSYGLFYINNVENKLVVKNSTFMTSYEKRNGWAIYLTSNNMHLIIDEYTHFYNETYRGINQNTWDSEGYDYLYVSENGGGSGISIDDPCTLSQAMGKINYGGVIYFVNNGNPWTTVAYTINKPIRFVGNGVTFKKSGIIFYFDSSNIIIENMTFIQCGGNNVYAPIILKGSSSRIINCTFINNTGQVAGAITNVYTTQDRGGGNSIIDKCVFINNAATSYYEAGSSSSTFDYGGHYSAGAIFIFSGNHIDVYNSYFKDNHAQNTGAISYMGSYNIVVKNNTFINNYATIYYVFPNNHKGGYGTAGALSVRMSTGDVSNCTFIDNHAPLAGAVYMQGEGGEYAQLYRGNAKLSNCTFIGNNATGDHGGGAIYLFTDSAILSNCDFKDNYALNGDGGAINLDGSSLNIESSSFTANKAKSGGAINVADFYGDVKLSGSNFTNNTNNILNLKYSSTSINHCNFIGNVNGTVVLNNRTNQTLNVDHSNFIKNNGVNGSAIYSLVLTTISYSSFDANDASGFGGAVYLIFDNCIVEYSNFTNNIAQEAAGALYILGSDDIIDHCRFIANIANSTTLGGGAIFNGGNNTLIMDSYFTHNNATNLGGAIYVIGGVAYSIDADTKATYLLNYCVNHTGEPPSKRWNNVYDGTAEELLLVVYVVLHPESWYGNDGILSENTGESWEDATNINYGFSRLSPKGSMIFVNGSEIYNYTGRTNVTNPFECNKIGIKFLGNNTTFIGLRFKINPRATDIEIYNFNFAGNNDTALIWDSTRGIIENCTFYDNGGRYCYKGAAMQVLKGNITIVNCRFISNEASYENVDINDGGGALFINASDVSIMNCIFDKNSANNGAHILLTENTNNILINSSGFFNGYGVDVNGHAIRVDSLENVQILYCNFTNNTLRDTYYYNGGAILVDSDIVYMLIKNCIFDNNTASSCGGALAFTGVGSMISVEDNLFINNNISGYTDYNTHIYYPGHYGGAVYVLSGEITFKNNNFTNNHAIFGGAIFNMVEIHVVEGSFTGNNAINGGAIYANGTLNVENVIFTDNNATKFGGAIFSNANTNLILCNYSNNFADYGGALYLNGTSNSLNNLNFFKNTASHGSAIYLTAGNKITVKNVAVFENNVTGFHNHDGKNGPCGDIHVKDDESITILDNSLTLGTIVSPETICINDVYWSDYIYVSNTGNGFGLGADDATSLKEALNHIRDNGKIIFISDEVYLDDLEIKNLNNITFVGNSTNAAVTFKRNSTNATNKGLLDIINSSINFENINLEMNLDLTNTTLNINNADIKSNITAGMNAELNLNNVTINASNNFIEYETGSSGSISNSSFTDVVGVDNIIKINGNVDIADTKFENNNITGSAVYYGPNGSGKVTNSTFINNTAQNGVRNINITDSSKVSIKDNTFDVFVSNFNLTSEVYGEDTTVNATFDAGINVVISDITLTFNDTFKTSQNVTVGKDNVFSFNLNGGVLGVGLYNLTAEDKNNDNTYLIKHINNNLRIIKAVVGANNIAVVEVSYGMNNTIIIKGTFNQTGTRVNYTGVVNVTITGDNGTIGNTSVKVINGQFNAVVLDQGRLGVGKYDVIVSNNGISDNNNYTVVNATFKNNLTVKKTVVCANYTTNVTVVYGMNNTITISGTFNASTYAIGGFARNYTGSVLVSITGSNGTIFNTAQVNNGKFSVVLTDDGRLGAGIYNISITTNENSANANYTLSNVTFVNNVTVEKAIVGANYTANVTVVYGMNDTIIVEGTFNSSIGANTVKYNGVVTVIISNGVYSITNVSVVVRDGKFSAVIVDGGKLGAGIYNVTVLCNAQSLNANYTVVNVTFVDRVNVTKAVVGANYTANVTVVYGMNDTIVIDGTFNASVGVDSSKYNGVVTVTISNGVYSITNASVVVRDGKFSAVIVDGGKLAVGIYNVTVLCNAQSLNANYTVVNVTFVDRVNVTKAVVGANYTANVTVVYGMNDTIVIDGTFNVSSMESSKYNGVVTVTISNGVYSITNASVVVRDGKFSAVIVDGGKLAVGIYNVTVLCNAQSLNANYTVVNVTFVDRVNVTKAVVGANYTANVTVVYGMNDTIVIDGTFNASVGVDSSKYNGVVTVTISNGVYSITNASVVVRDGKFSAVIVDGGKLGAGIYNVTVLCNAQSLNANYTVVNVTFVDGVNVTKAVVGANYTANVTVVYGMNDTIIVEGTFNASSGDYVKLYNGNVTVTINNGVYSITNASVVVRDGKFRAVILNQPELGVGIYNVTVSSNAQSLNANYTVSNNTFTDKVNVTKATVICQVNEITIVYGVNNTITIAGNVSNGTNIVKYNGFINLTVPNTNLAALNVEIRNGEFSVDIVDKGNLTVGKYSIEVKSNYINANYTFTNTTFNNNISVIPANVTAFDLINVTVVYGVNRTIVISGKVSNSTYGVKYNGLINITITNGANTIVANNILVANGTFNADVVDMGNLTAGNYDVIISSNLVNNYTFISKTFTNNVTVLKYNVTVVITKVNITYGDYNTINIYGNVSNSTYGQLYNGYVNVVVGNHTYNNVQVSNGRFTVEINDLSNYNVSINNVSVSEALINDNYVLNNVIFADYFIIESAASSINISSVTEKYGTVIVIPVTSENVTALIASVYTLDGQIVSNINVTVNGISSITIEGLPIGEFILNVTGVGDNNHIGCNASANITIIKASSKLVVDNLTVVYAPGNITVWYDVINATVDSFTVYDEYGNPVSCTIVKHKYTFDIAGLPAGRYTFNVTADGGINYENATSLSNIIIIPAGSKVVVPVVVITYGEHAILNVAGENLTGISAISILDSYGMNVGDYSINNFTVDVWNLNSSSVSYRVNVTASVDENHTVSSGIGLVFVKKAGSAIDVPDNFNITYGDVKTIEIKLDNVTVGDIIKIYVVSNGEIVNCDITQNGTNISIGGLAVGDYAIIVESQESTNYNASVGAGNFKVLKAGSSIVVPSETNMSHLGGIITIDEVVNATGISVKLFDHLGNQIRVSVNGFDIIFGRLDVGEYTLNVTTTVDSNHTSSSAVGKLYVLKMLLPSSVEIINITNGVYNVSDASAILNITNRTVVHVVVFKNGTNICVYNNTNFTGDIFRISNLTTGFYNITIYNAESDYYKASNASAIFKVVVPYTIIANDLSRGHDSPYDYVAKFCDEFGNLLVNTTVVMEVEGIKYNVTTDDVGVAYLTETTLPVGKHEIRLFNPVTNETAIFNITIVERLQENKNIVMDFHDGTYYVVRAYGDDAQPIAGVYVSITINGITYDVKTDEDGYAVLRIRLNPSSYKIGAEWKVTKTNKIVVRQTLKAKSVTAKKSKNLKFSATLKWSNGKAIVGKKIVFKFRGKRYVAKTNKKGIATVTIKKSAFKNLRVGKKYKISITYNSKDMGYVAVNCIIKKIKIKK